ncbi:hypothetical protein QZM64_05855 [Burkholderia cepacia]|uniref:hypothetical protein n=1 Tax=Burkholderia cepacia TaxID=292 RepID=UPI0026565FF9|nr:hypothetical protein [Burkholderia cepacia]MDN7438678.1 hypothetical protein [Burkholderia cepacia]
MLAVERLEDRQAFFEAGNPVASVEFGLFHRRKVASRCAVIAREWAIIARISPEAIANLKASIESTISILGGIERVTPIDLGGGVKGRKPRIRRRSAPIMSASGCTWRSAIRRATGSALTRATCVEDMPQGLPLFRCIAGTISLAKPR